MRLVVNDDAVLVDETGATLGRLVAIEIETVDLVPRRALTPTEVRDLVGCPFCNAEIGHFCRRWRGGDRKMNHAERVQFAVAELDRHEILSERSERYGNSDVDLSSAVQRNTENSFGEKDPNPVRTAAQIERDTVQRIWAYWIEVSGKRQKLDAKRERHIRAALKAGFSEDEIKRALLGLTRSPHHRGENEQRKVYMEVRYALRGIGDESDDERIEKAMTWAAIYAPNTTQLPQYKVERYLDEMRYTASLEHKPEAERARAAYRAVVAAGFKVVMLDKPPWVRLER